MNALSALGVHTGAAVDVDWTVDLSTPASVVLGPPDNRKEYAGAISAFTVKVGSWTVTRDGSSAYDVVKIVNNLGGSVHDGMHLIQGGSDTDLVLRGPGGDGALTVLLDLITTSVSASSNNDLDQNPDLYTDRNGYVSGSNGTVYFQMTGSGPTPPSGSPSAKCAAAQISSAAALCQAELKCLAKRAKAPAKDPVGVAAEACREKARQKYLTSFDKAGAAAAKKHLTCAYTGAGATTVTHLDDGIDAVAEGVDAIDPELPAVNSAWLTGAATMCSAGIKAESANAAKPNESKLTQARSKARSKLIAAATSAVAKAEKKGPVYDPDPSAADFADSIDSLIDDVSAQLSGGLVTSVAAGDMMRAAPEMRLERRWPSRRSLGDTWAFRSRSGSS